MVFLRTQIDLDVVYQKKKRMSNTVVETGYGRCGGYLVAVGTASMRDFRFIFFFI